MEYLAIFPSLAGFLIAFLFGKAIGDKGAQFVTCSGLIISAVASVALFNSVIIGQDPRTIILGTWIHSGDFHSDWALRFDSLSVVMMCVINIVSACVHIYSIGYMSHDPCKARFMSYLSLFTFAMLMLVSADNLLQLFFGWEGVGLASYLLIGFWNQKDSANRAAIKAFIVNRVGDFGLALGIMTLFVIFGSIEFGTIFEQAKSMADKNYVFGHFEVHALTLACLFLFVGAVGKSAQLGLHTWLPDAMEGPTPVSALIHAATMVTAGVFLVARFSPVFEYAPIALMVVCVFGAVTALVAATIGLTQFDIKRVIAYSTMSQLGYMFFALGVSAYGAAIFHLMTHAFFKALLFLGAGSVIHAMSEEQDMRKMGGIWKKIKITYVLMWIGSLALAGVPFLSGYYSKDMILESAFADHTWFGTMAFWFGIVAAFLTAFYSWRLILLTFHGKPRANDHVMGHIHESPKIMLLPLLVLAAGAIAAGAMFYPAFVGDMRSAFWGDSLFVLAENDTIHDAHHVPVWVPILPTIMGIAGIGLAYVFYLFVPTLPHKIASVFKSVHTLFYNKYFFDELYDKLFVTPSRRIGRFFWLTGDNKIIVGKGVQGMVAFSLKICCAFRTIQSGLIYHYAFIMIMAVIAFIGYYLIGFESGAL